MAAAGPSPIPEVTDSRKGDSETCLLGNSSWRSKELTLNVQMQPLYKTVKECIGVLSVGCYNVIFKTLVEKGDQDQKGGNAMVEKMFHRKHAT